MSKIFKGVKNRLDSTISVYSQQRQKTAVLVCRSALSSILFLGAANAAATPSTVGSGNLVTSENGITDGYNNTVTAIKGTAQGNDSVATGKNITREKFSELFSRNNALLARKTEKEGELSELQTMIEINQKTQEHLLSQIDNLTQIINQTANKSEQINELNNQISQKREDLTKLQDALNKAKEDATKAGDRTVWTDFTAQLGVLDWGNKLADSSGGTTGINKLATDLKKMVEKDYPEYSDQWGIDSYEEIITGYMNRQGLLDANQDSIGEKFNKNSNYYSFNFDVPSKSSYKIFDYDSTRNTRANASGDDLTNYLQRVREVSPSSMDIEVFNNLTEDTYKGITERRDWEKIIKGLVIEDPDRTDEKNATAVYSFYNLKNII
ncbi:hypothetical protein ACWIVU_10470, partial [Ursidibacter arcticus]